MPNVTTIVVTYNGSRWIKRCIDQLLSSEMHTHILVVDNASSDNTVEILQSYQDKIELIVSATNLGFGGGNNIGLNKVLKNADFVFLLNQDAYIDADCIGKLVHASQKNPAYGIISPVQLAPDAQNLDHAFRKYLPKSYTGSEGLIPVRFVNAAAWMLPIATINKVGIFHPVFAHYGEDNHYTSRTTYHELKIGVLTTAKVIHDREQTVTHNRSYLLRQLRTVPLYTLLDIRKPFFIAKFLGKRKLHRIWNKIPDPKTSEEQTIFAKQKKWFEEDVAEAKRIRKNTQQVFNLAN